MSSSRGTRVVDKPVRMSVSDSLNMTHLSPKSVLRGSQCPNRRTTGTLMVDQ
jgi:hypothetical protein